MKPGKAEKTPAYLFVVPWDLQFVGGVNEVIRNLYREFIEQNLATPAVVIPKWENARLVRQHLEGRETFHLRFPPLPCGWKNLPQSLAGFCIRAPATLWQLYTLMRREGITIVNPHYPGPFLWYFALLKKLLPHRFRLIISFHGSDLAAFDNGLHQSIMRGILTTADAVTAPSKALAARIVTLAPETAGKVTCIYNGIARDKFNPLPGESKLAPDVCTGDYILHVGSFERVKGQDVLLRAFKSVLQEHCHMKLLLVGREGTFLPEIHQLCQELGIADRVNIALDVAPEHIPLLMARSIFVVLPSRSEGGVPLVLLEAGAVRKAIIAADVGGIPELIIHGHNGLLVPTDNPRALSDAISLLIRDEKWRNHLGEQLNATVTAFSWSKTAAEYLRLGTGTCPA